MFASYAPEDQKVVVFELLEDAEAWLVAARKREAEP
ncbi:hypothetical protein BH09GEM1_BH09GEM1_25360 [soil metagenome]